MTTTLSLDEGYRASLGVAELHDVDEKHHQVVVDFPHNVLDSYRTDWAPGCWTEGFRSGMPLMVWNHDSNVIIGVGVDYEETPERTRLVGKYADFDAVPEAYRAYALERDHMIPGYSFHYRQGETIPHPNVRNARRFTRAKMMEFSPVPFPSIPGAKATGLRSRGPRAEALAGLGDAIDRYDYSRFELTRDGLLAPSPRQRRQAAIADLGTTLARIDARGLRR